MLTNVKNGMRVFLRDKEQDGMAQYVVWSYYRLSGHRTGQSSQRRPHLPRLHSALHR